MTAKPQDMLPVEELLGMGATYNPRVISRLALERLRASIRTFGAVEPVVVNKRTNVIVGGHQRVRAAHAEGVKKFPVVWVDLDPAKERLLNLSLNGISGSWDESKLVELIAELEELEADLTLTGLEDAHLASLLEVDDPIVTEPDTNGMDPESFGFGTSLARGSAPLRKWQKMGLLKGRVLDFGCGNEQHEFNKFDPFTIPDHHLLLEDWDVVMCNYVLNTQPSDHLIHQIAALIARLAPLACFAVVTEKNLSGTAACGRREVKSRTQWEAMLEPYFSLEHVSGSFTGFVGHSRAHGSD